MIKMLKNILNNGCFTENYSNSNEFISIENNIPLLQFDYLKCQKCNTKTCISVCPTLAIKLNNNLPEVISTKCIECQLCIDNCNHNAISISKFGIGSAEFNKITEKLKNEIKNTFKRSLHIRQLDCGSCNACDHEMISICNPVYDINRFGIDFVASPRHADCLFITGPITYNLKEALIRTINATPNPKILVGFGTCAISGEPFKPNYAHFSGANNVIKLDVLIPGCPPHPYSIIHGLLKIINKIKSNY